MQEVITVFQDYKTSLLGYENHFDTLLSFKEIVGSQNCILEANGDFRFSKYVGCIIKGNTCLQILPKIYSDTFRSNDHKEINESLDFVYRLLMWSGFLNVKHLGKSGIDEIDDRLIEIMIRVFITRFLELHQRNVYREYISQEVDQLYIRGKILFGQSVVKQIQKPGYVRIQCDEFSINNPINQIIKTAIQRLLFVTSNSENKKLLRLGLSYLEDVGLIPLHKDVFDLVVFNRMNEEYQPLIKLAEMMFQNKHSGLSHGEKEILAFLVPLNILFESFFNTVLQSIYSAPDKVVYQSANYLATNSSGHNVFTIKPDFTIKRGPIVSMILDTKYKNPMSKDGDLNIIASDIYQVCTYAMQYNCSSIFLVYPLFKWQDKKTVLEKYSIKNGDSVITLSIVQVDITEKNFDVIVNDVHNIFRPQK